MPLLRARLVADPVTLALVAPEREERRETVLEEKARLARHHLAPAPTLGDWHPKADAIAVSRAERRRVSRVEYERRRVRVRRTTPTPARKPMTSHRPMPPGQRADYDLICSRDELTEYQQFARAMGMTVSATVREAMAEYIAAADVYEDWR